MAHREQQRAVDGVDNVNGLAFTRSGRPLDQRDFGRAFRRARTAAGVDHGGLKTFRATVATQLAEAGLHPSKIQAFLGHAHVTTTLTYYTAIIDEVPASYPACTDRSTAEPRVAQARKLRSPMHGLPQIIEDTPRHRRILTAM